jgi:hypothetical protein
LRQELLYLAEERILSCATAIHFVLVDGRSGWQTRSLRQT